MRKTHISSTNSKVEGFKKGQLVKVILPGNLPAIYQVQTSNSKYTICCLVMTIHNNKVYSLLRYPETFETSNLELITDINQVIKIMKDLETNDNKVLSQIDLSKIGL